MHLGAYGQKLHLRHPAPSRQFTMVITQEPAQFSHGFAPARHDKCAYPEETAGHCPFLGDFALRGNAPTVSVPPCYDPRASVSTVRRPKAFILPPLRRPYRHVPNFVGVLPNRAI
jgi:hypothetical protein